jgi:anti-anti-sigma factor
LERDSTFRLEHLGPGGCFKLSGEVDMTVSDHLVELLRQSLDGARDIVLDLSELMFLDSGGIHALIRVSRLLDGRGRLIIQSPSGVVARVLEIVGADGFPNIEIRTADRRQPSRRQGVTRTG